MRGAGREDEKKDVSVNDKLRSFAESRSNDSEIIRDGLTYGDVREVLASIAKLRKELDVTEAEAAFRAGELAAQTGVPRDDVQGHWQTRGYAYASRLLRAIDAEAEVVRLYKVLKT